jgi:SAM-dependent methyltransferase
MSHNYLYFWLLYRFGLINYRTYQEVTKALKQAYKILKPGGRIYAVMLSPYVKGFAHFIPEFEKRIKDKQPFPGYVENLRNIADKSVIPEGYLKNLEKDFLFFNIDTAKSCFENSGFIIEKAIEMPLAYFSKIWQLDGRENIGIIGYKPKE